MSSQSPREHKADSTIGTDGRIVLTSCTACGDYHDVNCCPLEQPTWLDFELAMLRGERVVEPPVPTKRRRKSTTDKARETSEAPYPGGLWPSLG